MQDKDRAVLELTNDERAAMIEVREAEEFRAMSGRRYGRCADRRRRWPAAP